MQCNLGKLEWYIQLFMWQRKSELNMEEVIVLVYENKVKKITISI